MYKEQDHGDEVTHVSEIEARGGSRTRVTRNILVVSLLLVIFVLVATVGVGFFKTDQSGADGVTAENTARTVEQ